MVDPVYQLRIQLPYAEAFADGLRLNTVQILEMNRWGMVPRCHWEFSRMVQIIDFQKKLAKSPSLLAL